ncbi:hypothetical protein P280DRAFT_546585, partial [Massarina eburnea CBS 473.64]
MSFNLVPANLVLLSELGSVADGSKVRFLGCVDEYVVKTATLRLTHDYPPSSVPRVAHVNIELLLESIKRKEVDVGAWINVIGYVERRKEKGVFVQAIAVWDAGNVHPEAYGDAVMKRKDAE